VSGRQRYFQLNPKYPLFKEIRGIVTKTIGAAHLLAEALRNMEGIEEAYLYGSFARNSQDTASDIDVLIVGRPSSKALAQTTGKLERQLGREINYTVLTKAEFASRRARKDVFLENVWQNKRVSLIGPDEEDQAASRRLGANRSLPVTRAQKAGVRRKNSGVR
jgi:predicted nucleotidyltransferase